MTHAALQQVFGRVEAAKQDSDFTYFFALLLAGEALAKTVVLGMLAAVVDDRDRNRYRLEHSLVRSDGMGDWGSAIEDALTGPASQYLLADARREQAELTKLCRLGDWQHTAVSSLKATLDAIGIESEAVPVKTDMKRWFRLFATLRNGTRGHGATLPGAASIAAQHLECSIQSIADSFCLLRRPWAYLYRNISGKYRVSEICDTGGVFDYLKKETRHSLPNGVYLFLGNAPRLVPLIQSDAELRDFYFANGKFNGKRFELLSYVTDDKVQGDAAAYLIPPGTLPASETEGHGELLPMGNCLSNVPEAARDYVTRPHLEEELHRLLANDRNPIVTLVGAGGIGKTSLSLHVIQQFYRQKRYDVIVWLSARDVDLLPEGPKPVRRFVPSPDDMSQYYAKMVLSDERLGEAGFDARAFFEAQLQKCDLGPCLFVFDNFETTQNPVEMFSWIETFVRPPNKVLITTRLREFRGDYPLEVHGMAEEEARILVDQSAKGLGVSNLLTAAYVDQLVGQSEGHPYVIKVLLGEVANARKLVDIPRVIAGRDEILTALFERTYAALTPCAQRAFMTLAAWNSAVPRIALEAVMMRSVPERGQVESGIESLLRYSFVETCVAPQDKQEFLGLPLVTSFFGKRKLNVSPSRAAIQVDVELLQMLGPSRRDDLHLGLANRLERFIGNIARRVDAGEALDDYVPMLEMICRAYSPGWLIVARWHMERGTQGDFERAKAASRRFLEIDPAGSDAPEAWQMLGHACYQTHDALGEVHAFVERAQLGAVPYADVSKTANLLNRLLHEHELDVEKEEKQNFARRLLAVMEKRRSEADADAYSRMAWLAIHLGQNAKAKEYASAGLDIEPDNPHCLRIAQRPGLA